MRTSIIAIALLFGLFLSTVPVTVMGPTVTHPVDHEAGAVGDAPGLGATVIAISSVTEDGDSPMDGGFDAVFCQTGGSAYLGP